MDDWKKQAATANKSDNDVEKAFAAQAHAFIADRAGPLMEPPYALGFELVSRNEQGSRLIGMHVFRIGDELLSAPVFFINGAIKGTDLLHRHSSKTFVPFNRDWVDYLISRAENSTSGSAFSRTKAHQARPGLRLSSIAAPPTIAGAKFASEIEFPGTGEFLLPEFVANAPEAVQEKFAALLRDEDFGTRLLAETPDFIEQLAAAFDRVEANHKAASEPAAPPCSIVRSGDGATFEKLGFRVVDTDAPSSTTVREFTAAAVTAPGDGTLLVVGNEPEVPVTWFRRAAHYGYDGIRVPYDFQTARTLVQEHFTLTDAQKRLHGVVCRIADNLEARREDYCSSKSTDRSRDAVPFVAVQASPSGARVVASDRALLGDTTIPYKTALALEDKPTGPGIWAWATTGDGEQAYLFCRRPILVTEVKQLGRSHTAVRYTAMSLYDTERYTSIYEMHLHADRDEAWKPEYGGGRVKWLKLDENGDAHFAVEPLTHDGLDRLIKGAGVRRFELQGRPFGDYVVLRDRDTNEEYRNSPIKTAAFLKGACGLDAATVESLLSSVVGTSTVERFGVMATNPEKRASVFTTFVDRPTFERGFDDDFGIQVDTDQEDEIESTTRRPGRPMPRLGDRLQPAQNVNTDSARPRIVPPEFMRTATPAQLTQMAATGKFPKVFDHGVIASLAETYDTKDMLERYIPNLERGLDHWGRILFLFYWKPADFEQMFGVDDMSNFENMIVALFKSYGKALLLVLRRNQGVNSQTGTPGVGIM